MFKGKVLSLTFVLALALPVFGMAQGPAADVGCPAPGARGPRPGGPSGPGRVGVTPAGARPQGAPEAAAQRYRPT